MENNKFKLTYNPKKNIFFTFKIMPVNFFFWIRLCDLVSRLVLILCQNIKKQVQNFFIHLYSSSERECVTI